MTQTITYTIIQRVSLVAVAVVFITTAASAQEPNPAKDDPETQSIKRDGKRTNGRNHESGIPPQIANGAGDFVPKGGGTEVVRPQNKVDESTEADRRELVPGSKTVSRSGMDLALEQAAQRRGERAQSNFTFLLILAGGTVVLGLIWAVLALGRTRR